MTVSFLQMLGDGENSPTLIEARNAETACSPVLLPEVGKVLPGDFAVINPELREFLSYVSSCALHVPDAAGGVLDDEPGVIRIPLSNRDGVYALIDAEDYPLVQRYRWRYQAKRACGYAAASCQTNGKNEALYMHRLVLMALGASREVDHKNHNKLDNRKANLRWCTRAENARNTPMRSSNTSGAKGVTKFRDGWYACVTSNGERHQKFFSDMESAKQWASSTRETLHGEFACHDTHTLTPGEREAAIGLAASLIEHHVELYEISGCFTDRANADRARLAMEALIKGRTNQPKESHDEQA